MNRCANCHENIEKDTVWCPYCGSEQNPRYSVFKILFLFIALNILIIIGCYGYMVYKGYQEKYITIDSLQEV